MSSLSHPTVLVSIIIPCYNANSWIRDSIESCLNQTYSPIEVIVVDDGSSDGSLDVIKAFGNRIKWVTGVNRGGCAARNIGLEMARGDWIQYHDADDIMVRTCIEEKLNTPLLEGEIVCSDAALITHPDVHAWGGESGYSLDYVLRVSGPRTDGPLHRKSMLTAIGGFRVGIPCAQDYDLALRLMIRFGIKFKSNNKIGVLVRPLENSVSRGAGVKLPLTVAGILENAISELEKSAPMDGELSLSVSEHFAKIARTLWRYNAHQASLAAFARSRHFARFGYLRAYNNNVGRFLALLLGFTRFESLHSSFKRPGES